MRSSFDPAAPPGIKIEPRSTTSSNGTESFPVQHVVTMLTTFGPVVTISANYRTDPVEDRNTSPIIMGAVGPGCCAGPLNSRACRWCHGELTVKPFQEWEGATDGLLRPYIMLNPLTSELALSATLDFIELLSRMTPESWRENLPRSVELSAHG